MIEITHLQRSKRLINFGVKLFVLSLIFIVFLGGFLEKMFKQCCVDSIDLAGSKVNSTSTIVLADDVYNKFVAPKLVASEHVPLPDEVRDFYWTGWTAGSKRAD